MKPTPRQPLVLLVDDDVSTSALVEFQLREHGIRVSYAASLSLALALIPAVLPDVVILDLILPETSPRTNVARVRHTHPGRLILVTGVDTLLLSELAMEHRAEVLSKPYDVDQLARSLLAGKAML